MENRPPLTTGDSVPHVAVTLVNGTPWDYAAAWQRRNLLLVTLPAAQDAATNQYIADLDAATDEWRAMETICVVTHDLIPGLVAPGVLVADRWGEVQFVVHKSSVAELPDVATLLVWVRSVEHQCPECQGEAL